MQGPLVSDVRGDVLSQLLSDSKVCFWQLFWKEKGRSKRYQRLLVSATAYRRQPQQVGFSGLVTHHVIFGTVDGSTCSVLPPPPLQKAHTLDLATAIGCLALCLGAHPPAPLVRLRGFSALCAASPLAFPLRCMELCCCFDC